jgi:hypothetical protein
MRRVADPQATPVGNLPVRPGLAGFISERWPASFRNGGRHQIGMPGRNASEFAPFLAVRLFRLEAERVFPCSFMSVRPVRDAANQ